MKCKQRMSLFYSLLAVLPLTALVAAPAEAGCESSRAPGSWGARPERFFSLKLPDGEDSVECRMSLPVAPDWRGLFPGLPGDSDTEAEEEAGEETASNEDAGPPSRWQHNLEKVLLDVYGSGTLEVEVRFTGSATEQFPGVLHLRLAEGDLAGVAGSYADIVSDPSPERYTFDIALLADALRAQLILRAQSESFTAEQLDEWWGSPELVMKVRRIRQTCWMAAWVTGDVSETRRFDGDVAWFRTAEVPVKKGLMMGTGTDMELAEAMSSQADVESVKGALDLAAQMGFITEEQQAEVAPEVAQMEEEEEQIQGEDQSFAQAIRELSRPEDGEEGDNFGLNLVALDLDANPQSDFAAAKMLTSAFTLSLSGRVMDYAPDEETDSARVDFHISEVQATVGLGDQGGNRIPFVLGDLQGWFTTTEYGHDFIVGFLAGKLESKGKYSHGGMVREGSGYVAAEAPRILKIGVVTKFAARLGAFSCTN